MWRLVIIVCILFAAMHTLAIVLFFADRNRNTRILRTLRSEHMGFEAGLGEAWVWSLSRSFGDAETRGAQGPIVRLAAIVGVPVGRIRAALPEELLPGSVALVVGRSQGMGAQVLKQELSAQPMSRNGQPFPGKKGAQGFGSRDSTGQRSAASLPGSQGGSRGAASQGSHGSRQRGSRRQGAPSKGGSRLRTQGESLQGKRAAGQTRTRGSHVVASVTEGLSGTVGADAEKSEHAVGIPLLTPVRLRRQPAGQSADGSVSSQPASGGSRSTGPATPVRTPNLKNDRPGSLASPRHGGATGAAQGTPPRVLALRQQGEREASGMAARQGGSPAKPRSAAGSLPERGRPTRVRAEHSQVSEAASTEQASALEAALPRLYPSAPLHGLGPAILAAHELHGGGGAVKGAQSNGRQFHSSRGGLLAGAEKSGQAGPPSLPPPPLRHALGSRSQLAGESQCSGSNVSSRIEQGGALSPTGVGALLGGLARSPQNPHRAAGDPAAFGQFASDAAASLASKSAALSADHVLGSALVFALLHMGNAAPPVRLAKKQRATALLLRGVRARGRTFDELVDIFEMALDSLSPTRNWCAKQTGPLR